jgi:DNA polymerase I-like protein with 3'-5' exonuclease and polymerase domains
LALKLQSRDLYKILEEGNLSGNEVHQAYNALDSAVTLRVQHALQERIRTANTPHATTAYNFVRAMQGPAMEMMNRGVKVQTQVRQDETTRYQSKRDAAQALLDRLADAVWGPEHYVEVTKTKEWYQPVGKRGQLLTPRERTVRTEVPRTRPRGLNANSGKQCLAFFNVALGRPVEYEIRKTPQGRERTPTANDKALRKWGEQRTKGPGVPPRDPYVYPVQIAKPFVSLILTIREMDKNLEVLKSPLEPGNRISCSYNVAGTENWRWSSSANAYGRGTNLQNITASMRRMFCADDGYMMVSTDLEQAESYVVAGLVWQVTGDDVYWKAILSGDLHTAVCRMAWPEMGWNGDKDHDRAIADSPYPDLGMSYRDVAKRIGHGSNYNGSAWGIAAAVGIPVNIVEYFQRRYFRAFPAIRIWHAWVRTQILDHQFLDTPLGTRRWFFGRPTEDSTIREAIACVPQGTVALLLNAIMWKCWARSLPHDPFKTHNPLPIELLLQNHDAFLFQTKTTNDLVSVIREVNAEFQSTRIPLIRGDEQRFLVIPGEFVTGFNWAYKDKDPDKDKWTFTDGNPDGLRKWGGADTRQRRQSAEPSLGDWLNRPR